MIDTPGIYAIPAVEYHANPCPTPALSSSIAKILCSQSPAHAKAAMQGYREESDAYDIGNVAHALLLEGRESVEVIDAKDWRTNKAKEWRDAARADGKTPLLKDKWAEVEAMLSRTRIQLEAHRDGLPLFQNGTPEQTLIWQEGDLWCRARLDWLHSGHNAIDDYKTTSATANPEAISRTLFANGWDVQAAFYLRGLRALSDQKLAHPPAFRFVVQETYPPYALSVIALGPDAMTLGEKKVIYALDLWRECLTTDTWPAYPTRTCYASLPAYEESRWLEKELA